MDEGSIYLIIQIRAGENVVDALPLTFITIRTSDAVLTMGIFCKVIKSVLTNLLEDRTIWAIVEVASNDDVGIG